MARVGGEGRGGEGGDGGGGGGGGDCGVIRCLLALLSSGVPLSAYLISRSLTVRSL